MARCRNHKWCTALKSLPNSCAEIVNETEAEMTTIGYSRVSSDGQSLDAQQDQLRAAGADKIFSEKVSGAVRTGESWHGQ